MRETSYTKFKNWRRKFPRLQIKVRFIKDIRCIHLAQVDKISSWNSNTEFLRVSVDVFSRFVRVQPIRNRNTETTKAAFIRNCSEQVNNLISPKKCPGSIKGGSFLETLEISSRILKFLHTILSARRKPASLNVPWHLWNLWFTRIWKKKYPIAIFRKFKTLWEYTPLASADPQSHHLREYKQETLWQFYTKSRWKLTGLLHWK